MSSHICKSCRSSILRAASRAPRSSIPVVLRSYSSASPRDDPEPQNAEEFDDSQENAAGMFQGLRGTSKGRPSKPHLDVKALLATPTWSVRSLLPDPSAPISPEDEITPKKLHHLLRLSALPLPKSKEEENAMLATLHSQLHFVRDIQKVNTDGVRPLQSIRDETAEGMKEITINMESLKDAFAKEEIKGRNKRPRRKRTEERLERVPGVEDWDPLSTAKETVQRGGGRYFIVRSGKGPQMEELLDPEVRLQGTVQGPQETLTQPSHKKSLPKVEERTLANKVFEDCRVITEALINGAEESHWSDMDEVSAITPRRRVENGHSKETGAETTSGSDTVRPVKIRGTRSRDGTPASIDHASQLHHSTRMEADIDVEDGSEMGKFHSRSSYRDSEDAEMLSDYLSGRNLVESPVTKEDAGIENLGESINTTLAPSDASEAVSDKTLSLDSGPVSPDQAMSEAPVDLKLRYAMELHNTKKIDSETATKDEEAYKKDPRNGRLIPKGLIISYLHLKSLKADLEAQLEALPEKEDIPPVINSHEHKSLWTRGEGVVGTKQTKRMKNSLKREILLTIMRLRKKELLLTKRGIIPEELVHWLRIQKVNTLKVRRVNTLRAGSPVISRNSPVHLGTEEAAMQRAASQITEIRANIADHIAELRGRTKKDAVEIVQKAISQA